MRWREIQKLRSCPLSSHQYWHRRKVVANHKLRIKRSRLKVYGSFLEIKGCDDCDMKAISPRRFRPSQSTLFRLWMSDCECAILCLWWSVVAEALTAGRIVLTIESGSKPWTNNIRVQKVDSARIAWRGCWVVVDICTKYDFYLPQPFAKNLGLWDSPLRAAHKRHDEISGFVSSSGTVVDTTEGPIQRLL